MSINLIDVNFHLQKIDWTLESVNVGVFLYLAKYRNNYNVTFILVWQNLMDPPDVNQHDYDKMTNVMFLSPYWV